MEEFKPREYQEFGLEHIKQHPYAGLFQDMGLGKTVICLNYLMWLKDQGAPETGGPTTVRERHLVIAPLRVAENTWSGEIKKWKHLSSMTYSKVLGSVKARKAALKVKADVYIINRENVPWLVALYGGAWPFSTVIIDESTSFKNQQSIRWKALKMVRPYCKRVIVLTGTPRPQGLLDLWPQLYLLDRGERLGPTISGFRGRYFNPGAKNGHVVYDYNLKTGDALLGTDVYEREIYEKIGDICISMKTEDYLELPDLIENNMRLELPADIKRKYDDFERKQVLALASGDEITPLSAAGLSNKLTQFANGAVYDEDKKWHLTHDIKLDALEELIESAQEDPMLVFYTYQSDLERILARIKNAVKFAGAKELEAWNEGKIQVMLAHPASAGHGLNFQHGGHLLTWFGQTWNSEYFSQGVKRLHRSGQRHDVVMNRLIARGTIDEDILTAVNGKLSGQDAMMEAIKARIEKWS